MSEEAEPPAGAEDEPKQGKVEFQNADDVVKRELSLAEKRARKKAEEDLAAQETAAAEAAERKAKLRKRVLIGAGVTVGLAAVIGVSYLALRPSTVTARCVTTSDDVSSDQYCDRDYVYAHGGYINPGGIIFMPIIGGGYRQYHYSYGGSVAGGKVSGGSVDKPSGATIKTGSGTTIQRGGFGLGNSGKSGTSGKSGGSSGGKSGGS
jgi:hypothetical protein